MPVVLDWSRREGESKMKVLPTMGGYARLMARQAVARAADMSGVGIVGGGLLGLGIAHRLAERGVRRVRLRAGAELGGLAGTTDLGGIQVDRYYHAVTTTDHRVLALAARSSG